MNLRKIGLENVRCFHQPTSFNVKPITVLVGKNSSGKSTLSRLFPLLRQSFAKSTKGPILWYGEYVDFGSIESSRTRDSDKQEIKILLQILVKKSPDSGVRDSYLHYRHQSLYIAEPTLVDIELTISDAGGYDHSYCKAYKLSFAGNEIEVSFNDPTWVSTININGKISGHDKEDGIKAFVSGDSFLPEVAYARKSKLQDALEWYEPPHMSNLIDYIKNRTHASLSTDKIRELITRFGIARDNTLIQSLKKYNPDSVTLKAFARSLTTNSQAFKDIKRDYIRANLSGFVKAINLALSEEFSKVKYVKPVRATASRYYRNQEFSVAEIDADGANIAMYIDSLSSPETNSLNEFLAENLGIEVYCNKSGGHLALNIKEVSSETQINIADMGFGYSQVLPIMLQTWAAQKGQSTLSTPNASSDMILVIEQPELHLHPGLQATLADVFSNFANSSPESSIILETHSPHIINRLGELIFQKKLDASKVNIVLVEHTGSRSSLREIKFDGDGILQNWPFGFFEPK